MILAYRDNNCFFNKIDPITKFIWCIITTAWIYSIRDFFSVLVINSFLLIISIFFAKLEINRIPLAVFLTFTTTIGLTLYQGLFRIGPGIAIGFLNLSYEGMYLGVTVGFRLLSTILIGLILAQTTRPSDFVNSLIKVGIPYRFAHTFYLSLRFIPIISRDYEFLNLSSDVRNIRRSFFGSIKKMVALVLTEIGRTDRITIGLETRLFGLNDTRTIMKPVKISIRGVMLNILTVMMILLYYLM